MIDARGDGAGRRASSGNAVLAIDPRRRQGAERSIVGATAHWVAVSHATRQGVRVAQATGSPSPVVRSRSPRRPSTPIHRSRTVAEGLATSRRRRDALRLRAERGRGSTSSMRASHRLRGHRCHQKACRRRQRQMRRVRVARRQIRALVSSTYDRHAAIYQADGLQADQPRSRPANLPWASVSAPTASTPICAAMTMRSRARARNVVRSRVAHVRNRRPAAEFIISYQ